MIIVVPYMQVENLITIGTEGIIVAKIVILKTGLKIGLRLISQRGVEAFQIQKLIGDGRKRIQSVWLILKREGTRGSDRESYA